MIDVAIDIETTGLNPNKHEICDIAVVQYNDKFEKTDISFRTLVRPMLPATIDPSAMEINGLTWDRLKKAPTPQQALSAFMDWKVEMFLDEELRPLGHNYDAFDARFLRVLFDESYNKIFYRKSRDSQKALQVLKDAGIVNWKSLSLANVCKELGLDKKYKSHTAYGDACASLEIYKRCIERIKHEGTNADAS